MSQQRVSVENQGIQRPALKILNPNSGFRRQKVQKHKNQCSQGFISAEFASRKDRMFMWMYLYTGFLKRFSTQCIYSCKWIVKYIQHFVAIKQYGRALFHNFVLMKQLNVITYFFYWFFLLLSL